MKLKRPIIIVSFLILLISVSCSSALKVTEVTYENVAINLDEAIEILERTKPATVPAFPDPLPEGAGEIDTLVYLGNVISAYKTSLEAWQYYSESQTEVLNAIQEELKNEQH